MPKQTRTRIQSFALQLVHVNPSSEISCRHGYYDTATDILTKDLASQLKDLFINERAFQESADIAMQLEPRICFLAAAHAITKPARQNQMLFSDESIWQLQQHHDCRFFITRITTTTTESPRS